MQNFLLLKEAQIDQAMAEDEPLAIRKPPRTICSYRLDVFSSPMTQKRMAFVGDGQKLSDHATIFHNCPLKQVVVHQTQARRKTTGTYFALALEIFDFDGDYFSMSIALPEALTNDLQPGEIFKVDLNARSEYPVESYLRLNTNDGPNRKDHSEQMKLSGKTERLNFDPQTLSANLNETYWLDLFLNDVAFNRITLDDLVIHRCRMSEL